MDKRHAVLALLAGSIMMVLEVAGARLLYPYFGSSMAVWTMIIGMFMTVLSVGYYLGGKLSQKNDAESRLSLYIASSGLAVAMLPVMVPILANMALNGFFKLFICSLAVSLPALSLSLVSPVLIEMSGKCGAGKAAGIVYAVSTVGSIAGTFASAFFLLPTFGVASTIASTGILMSVLGLIFKSRKSSISFFFAGVLLLLVYSKVSAFGIPTTYYTVDIVEKEGNRYLYADNMMISALNLSDPATPVFAYAAEMKAEMAKKGSASRVAIIGAGGCAQVHHVRDLFPEAEIYLVDIDSKMFGICEAYFEVKENAQTHFYVQDGREFLRDNGDFDVIIVDAFSSGCTIPQHIGSREFFTEAGNSLKPGGVVLVNFISFQNSRFSSVLCNTIRESFSDVECRPLGENNLTNFIVSASGPKKEYGKFGDEIITDDRNPVEVEYGTECLSLR